MAQVPGCSCGQAVQVEFPPGTIVGLEPGTTVGLDPCEVCLAEGTTVGVSSLPDVTIAPGQSVGISGEVEVSNDVGNPIPVTFPGTGIDVRFPGQLIDAFSRLRVSNPVTLIDLTHQYGLQPKLMEQVVVGGATGVHNAAQSSADMTVSAAGDSIFRQSRVYVRYQPSKSLLTFITFSAGDGDPAVRFRAGKFDGSNGHFLQRSGSDASLVERTSESGVPVDNVVPQASWNLDPLDGTGPSGLTLDLTKSQILWSDQEWLGVGTVRMGFVIDGQLIACHAFHHANIETGVYATTASLPVRWELEAVGVPAAPVTSQAICAAVVSEGGTDDERTLPFTASTRQALKSIAGAATLTPVISLRPRLTVAGVVNRTNVIIDAIETISLNSAATWALVYGPTLTGATWAAASPADAAVQVDTAATSYVGGTEILSGFVPAGQGNQSAAGTQSLLRSRLPIVLDVAGVSQQVVTLAAMSVDGGSINFGAAINWRETR